MEDLQNSGQAVCGGKFTCPARQPRQEEAPLGMTLWELTHREHGPVFPGWMEISFHRASYCYPHPLPAGEKKAELGFHTPHRTTPFTPFTHGPASWVC